MPPEPSRHSYQETDIRPFVRFARLGTGWVSWSLGDESDVQQMREGYNVYFPGCVVGREMRWVEGSEEDCLFTVEKKRVGDVVRD